MSAKSQQRVKGISIARPIVYGNVAAPLGDELGSQPDHTHKWTISVRGVNNEDISYYVKKVVFKLHETYTQPNRTVDKPPFEVSETGWGEFEIAIKIYFQNVSGEKPITLFHHLRLHPLEALTPGPTAETNKALLNQPVVAYHYDEIVFNEPLENFFHILLENQSSELVQKTTLSNPYSLQAEQEELTKLEKVNQQVERMIEEYRSRMTTADVQSVQLRQEISTLEASRK
ncbi:NuA4 histone H4 acetyltransferase complex and the SWR1 complex subunit [Dispira simplex]|nr:NuA4 histone H4 acetyltransferase complex and the SWR1 complex subunit [Dispira simplex]